MKRTPNTIFVTQDNGLLAHWQKVLGKSRHIVSPRIEDFFQLKPSTPSIAWIDLSLAGRPLWTAEIWREVLQGDHLRVIAASSNPNDNEGMLALDAGCAAYCHAFSDSSTLKQVKEVVEAGHVWIGKALMQRLLQGVNRVVTAPPAQDGP
jgi:DNA-binding NarL/FixJ family response regulator